VLFALRHGAQSNCVLLVVSATAIPPDGTGPGAPGPGRQKRELAFAEAETFVLFSLSRTQRGEKEAVQRSTCGSRS
jgi:hypothetical protein